MMTLYFCYPKADIFTLLLQSGLPNLGINWDYVCRMDAVEVLIRLLKREPKITNIETASGADHIEFRISFD